MKNLFTLLIGFVALVLTSSAQNSNIKINDGTSLSRVKHPLSNLPKRHIQSNGNRSSTDVISLDYDGFDEAYSAISGGDYTRYAWDINSRYAPTNVLTLKYAAVVYDTLLYLDGGGNPAFIPRSAASFVLDSFDVIYNHQNTSHTNDTLTFTIFNRSSLVVSGIGTPSGTLTATPLWDTVIITNSSLSTTTGNFEVLSFFPNLSFATGQTFGIRVDFKGDTLDKFELSIGSRDDCAAACIAAPSAAGFNTYAFLNWDGQNPNTGLYNNSIFFDCNGTNAYEPGDCENIFLQDAGIIPFLTLNTTYGTAIVSDSLKGCPGTVLNLSANTFGSTATPYTYSWASSSGSFSTTTDQLVSYIVGNSGTVTVTVTDANNVTTSSSVNIVSKGVTVAITNPSPVNLACGSSATISTSLTGTQTGKNYTWSTGTTGTSAFSISVNRPGAYSVTVTNNSGCSSTATVNVIYPSVSNTLGFNPPASPICKGTNLTFTNTSTQQGAGWAASWDMGNGDLVNTINAIYNYATAGGYTVKLTMDSAGCAFSYSRNINVVANCVNGIDDVEFSNAITLQPNPSTGNVTIVVNGIDKNLSVSVYNVIGSEVKTFSTGDVTSTFSKSFDFSDLSNGTYLMKIQSADKVAVKRFTISK